jgi:hypothetical protein
MPFLNGSTLLFCSADGPVARADSSARRGQSPRHGARRYRPWKLMYCDWKSRRPHRIETGLPADSVECSPAFYQANGRYFVSFIGGLFHNGLGRPDPLVYHLYTMSGPSLDRLEAPIQFSDRRTPLGFVSPRYVCNLQRGRLCVRRRGTDQQSVVELPMLPKLLRATYRADHLDSLIVTGLDQSRQPQSLLVRLDTKEISEIRTTGPVYKCSIYGTELIHAEQTGRGFEERRLMRGEFQSALRPEKLRIKRRDKKERSA